jgi:hypothetical protein
LLSCGESRDYCRYITKDPIVCKEMVREQYETMDFLAEGGKVAFRSIGF